MEFTVRVFGIPAPQGSKDAVKNRWTGKTNLIESSKKLAPWRKAIIKACIEAMRLEQPWRTGGTGELAMFPDGAVGVETLFSLPRPPSIPKSRLYPMVRPDLDKLDRAVLDSLTKANIYRDDSQVCSLRTDKRYAPAGCEPGAEIRIFAL